MQQVARDHVVGVGIVHTRRILGREHVRVDRLAEHLELAEHTRQKVAAQVLPVEVVLEQHEQLGRTHVDVRVV